ncbi:MAG TPA: CHAD domain-containing protein, partial [Gaiellaceae bacterium]|nr:CHAD domain-containing protein [Gaiellaceae bacterium]
AGMWQLKLPKGASRVELEEHGPPGRAPASLVVLLTAYLRGESLTRVARLKTWRKSIRTDGAEIVDDSVAILDGQRITGRFRELEVELLDGDERTLRRLEKALRQAGATVPVAFEPKLFRALELAHPVEPQEVAPDATPIEAVGVSLARQYRQLLVHDPGVRLGIDAEDVHQMRVATRRARAFLRVARPFVDSDWAEGLRAELGWLGSALGPVRDLDVLLEHLHEDLATLGEEDRLGDLVESLESELASARKEAIAALDDERYLRLLDRLEAASEPPAAPDPSTETLASVWSHELDRLRRTFARLDGDSTDRELHRARIRAKRARYAAELAVHELGDPGRRFVEAAKKLQDVLGEHQDACVASERFRAWAASAGEDGRAVKRLVAREKARRRRSRSAWPKAWKQVAREGRAATRRKP